MAADRYAEEAQRLTAIMDWLDEKAKDLHTQAIDALADGDQSELARLEAEWNVAERWFIDLNARRYALAEQSISAVHAQFRAWQLSVTGVEA